jgi:hypothetical protein
MNYQDLLDVVGSQQMATPCHTPLVISLFFILSVHSMIGTAPSSYLTNASILRNSLHQTKEHSELGKWPLGTLTQNLLISGLIQIIKT